MNKKNLHIYYSSFNTKNGAAASLIDLANSASEVTCVYFFITKLPSSIKQILTNRNKRIKIIYTTNFKPIQRIIFKFFDVHKTEVLCIDAIKNYDFLKEVGYKNIVNYFAADLRALIQSKIYSDSDIKLLIKELLKFKFLLVQSKSTSKDLANYNIKSKTLLPTCDEFWLQNYQKNKTFNPIKTIVISIIGSIQERKNQLDAIEFGYQLSKQTSFKVTLKIVGKPLDNNYYKLCQEKSHKLSNLNYKIDFTGHLDDYRNIYNTTDIILQTSLSEGFSRILREAMYLKIPICAYVLPSNKEHICEHRSINAPVGDLNSLIINLTESLNNNEIADIVNNATIYYNNNLSTNIYKKNLTENLLN
jgi:hypothetical protein